MNFLNIQFENSLGLWLLPCLVILLVVIKILVRKSFSVFYPVVRQKKYFFGFSFLSLAHFFLEITLLVFLCLGFSKPYLDNNFVAIEEEGIDILFLLDVSASMQAKDFPPTRLEATKILLKDFIRKNSGHRLGLVIFAKHSFPLSSLTNDSFVLRQLVDSLNLQIIDHIEHGGSSLGDALIYGVDFLEKSKIPNRDQTIILLSDGDFSLGIDPLIAAKYVFFEKKINVHVIGLGNSEPVRVQPSPQKPSWFFDTRLNDVILKEIAAITRGNYFYAADVYLLEQIFKNLSHLAKTPLKTKMIIQKKDLTFYCYMAVAILFLMALLLNFFFLRRPLK